VPAPHVTFREHDIRLPWPAPDGEADLAVGNLVLEHVAELRPVLAEAARVLRPGGVLWLCELHPVRQLRGAAARFATAAGEARVEAYLHLTEDYVGAALAAGFSLAGLAEPRDPQPPPEGPPLPRLLQMTFVKVPPPRPG